MKRLVFACFLVVSIVVGCGCGAPARAQEGASKQKLNVAILIFDGVQIVDYTGPYEALGSGGRRNVYTVAEKPDVITTAMGMRVVPNYTFANQPMPDIIVVPGGGNSGEPPSALARAHFPQLSRSSLQTRAASLRSKAILADVITSKPPPARTRRGRAESNIHTKETLRCSSPFCSCSYSSRGRPRTFPRRRSRGRAQRPSSSRRPSIRTLRGRAMAVR
jgi:hypothetical protein